MKSSVRELGSKEFKKEKEKATNMGSNITPKRELLFRQHHIG